MDHNGFSVRYDGSSVVSITKCGVSAENYDSELSAAFSLRSKFSRSKAGSDWGCDGVGYAINLKNGLIDIKRSGVGPRKFAATVKTLKG